ncbi:aminomethyl-transferring glycine dehydrogenase subunit GcvPA [Coprothermobacteraceae bacterium]|nr:aminomethyl-transferring glycine dehydrogenase subunit GcvPA [Coprothermobacteraceae bacterium]
MRYAPHSPEEVKEMLRAIGLERLEQLFDDIPTEALLKRHLNVEGGWDEERIRAYFRKAAAAMPDANKAVYFLGGGIYDHYVPALVDKVLSLPEFYTAYTPYQAEVSQGTLVAMFEYQSLICELTGMEVTNASMYDGASAAAEAALMAMRIKGIKRIAVSKAVHPDIFEVLHAYQVGQDFEIVEIPVLNGLTHAGALDELPPVAGLLVQSPNYYGFIENMPAFGSAIHEKGGLFIAAVDPLSLGVLKSPKEYQADIVVGEGQSLGNHMNFGGPHFGFLATKMEFVRDMPGRMIGETNDVDGRVGYVMTLQTREQHIRREKATSNICSNHWLMALASVVYLGLMGGSFKELGESILTRSTYLAEQLAKVGYPLRYRNYFFKEFPVHVPNATEVQSALAEAGYFVGPVIDENTLLVAVTEKRTREEIDGLVGLMEGLR